MVFYWGSHTSLMRLGPSGTFHFFTCLTGANPLTHHCVWYQLIIALYLPKGLELDTSWSRNNTLRCLLTVRSVGVWELRRNCRKRKLQRQCFFLAYVYFTRCQHRSDKDKLPNYRPQQGIVYVIRTWLYDVLIRQYLTIVFLLQYTFQCSPQTVHTACPQYGEYDV